MVTIRLTVPSPKVISISWTNSKGAPKDATNRLAVSVKLPLDLIFGFCCSVSPATEQGVTLTPGSKQLVTLSRLPLLASLTEPEMVVSNKRLLPVGAVNCAPEKGKENVSSVVVPFVTVTGVCIVAKLAVPGMFVVMADAATTEPQATARTKTGLQNDLELVNAALAVLAAPDDFGPWFAAQAGRLRSPGRGRTDLRR